MHLAITDSGLGGLSVCAAIERAWRDVRPDGDLRITYVNAWPEEGPGYNDLQDVAARATVFDRALASIDRFVPDRILIACNTLSIVYGATARSRQSAGARVQGIIDAGVGALRARAARNPDGVDRAGRDPHHDRVRGSSSGAPARGIDDSRVTAASCHGLATAIEAAIGDAKTRALIETCAERAASTLAGDGPVFMGLCCTHYGMVSDELMAALARRVAGPVGALDPNLAWSRRSLATARAVQATPLRVASVGAMSRRARLRHPWSP